MRSEAAKAGGVGHMNLSKGSCGGLKVTKEEGLCYIMG